VISGFIVSIAGSLMVIDRGLALYTPLLLMIKAIAIVLLIRPDRILELLIGSILIGITQYLIGFLVGELWRQLLIYALLMIVLALSAIGIRVPYFHLSIRDWPFR
jgi:branched-subunit amino acid ABC-type transport system permease component